MYPRRQTGSESSQTQSALISRIQNREKLVHKLLSPMFYYNIPNSLRVAFESKGVIKNIVWIHTEISLLKKYLMSTVIF